MLTWMEKMDGVADLPHQVQAVEEVFQCPSIPAQQLLERLANLSQLVGSDISAYLPLNTGCGYGPNTM